MKKFFTLICAIAIAFSASAAQIAPKAELVKKAPVAVEMQKVQIEQAQFANFNQLSATPAMKVNNLKGKVAPAVKPAARKLATGEPIVVIIDGTPSIQPAGNVQAITVIGKDNMVYAWGVKATSLEAGKTYAFTDMSTDFTYRCSQDYFTTYEDPTDATFSIDAEKNITASMVTESGTYMVYTKAPQPSYDTIPVTVAAYQEKYYASSLDWQVIMVDAAGNGYSFDIFAPAEGLESGKTYTSDNGDFDLDYTYAAVNKVNDFAVKASFTKTVSATEIKVVAEMTTAANHVYQFTYTEKIIQWTEWAKFAPLGKSTGTWTFGAVSSFSGATCVSNIYVREDKENSAKQQIKVEGWGAQVLTASGVDLIIDWDTITNVCTIAEQSTGAYQSAYQEYTMISDLNTYTGKTDYPSSYDPATGKFSLAVVYYISAGQFGYGTETLQMKSSEIKPLDYDATDADFSADFSNDDTKVSITDTTATVSATDADLKTLSLEMYVTSGSTQIPAGDYTITDSKEVGTALASEGVSGGYVTASFAGNRNTLGKITAPMWFLVEGNVNVAYNGYIMTMTVAAKNSNGKNINITVTKDYTPITERDTVKVNLNGLMIEEDLNSQTGTHRGWLFEGQDTDTLYLIQVLGTEKYGTFSYADGTLGKNMYNIIPSSGQGRCQFTEGEVTIAEDQDGIKLTGLFVGEDEKAYVFNWILPAGVIMGDTDAPFDAEFNYNDMKASIKDGVIGIYATNAEGLTIGLKLYADPAATEIPAGVYTISDSQEAGTALKSLGINGGYLTECFAGIRGTSGISIPCWFMVEGTVTLSYDEYGKLKVEVNAKNSYGQDVTALVQYTALEYYLVGWIDGAAYGIEGDIDNFGDYKFVDGKVTATFNEDSYVQVKDNNKQIYGTASYVAPVAEGTSAIVLATGTEKMGVYAGEYEFTLDIAEDGTMTLSYVPVATGLYRINANTAIRKALINGHVVIFKNNKTFNLMGAEL